MKALMRSVALRVPPIGRLYDYALQQARENQERAAAIAALTAEHAAAIAALTVSDESRLWSDGSSLSCGESQIRNNVEFWKQLQDADYFEKHPCYNGLVDMGDAECGVIECGSCHSLKT